MITRTVLILAASCGLLCAQTNPWKRVGSTISPRRSGDSVAIVPTLPASPDPALWGPWQTAMRGTGLKKVVLLGDSIGEGYNSGGTLALSQAGGWANKVRVALQSLFGNAGDGFLGSNRTDRLTYVNGTGGWLNYEGFGIYRAGALRTVKYASAANNTVAVTATCDRVDIYYLTNTDSAAFEVFLDNVSQGTFGGTTSATPAYAKVTVGPWESGSHTVKIAAPAAPGKIYLYGIAPLNGTTGAVLHNMSQGGMRAADVLDVSVFSLMQPDLVIVSLGVNDSAVSTTDTFRTDLSRVLTQAKATGASLFVLDEPTGSSTTITTNFHAVSRPLAWSFGAAYTDVFLRWGSSIANAKTAGMVDSDGTHPTAAGQIDMASAVLGIILGQNAASAVNPTMSAVKTVKGSDGADCTITFRAGLMVATTCP